MNPPTTAITEVLSLKTRSGRHSWRGFLIIPIALSLAWCASSQTAHAITPAPGGSYPNGNTAEGTNALFSLTSGTDNTAIGNLALYTTTTGIGNTATGGKALYTNSGSYNTATGYGTLYNNSNGIDNTANGFKALLSNTAGVDNAAIGFEALYSNTLGYDNTANGNQALCSNINGVWNTAVGSNALFSNMGPLNDTASYNGIGNTATGYQALFSNTTGHGNVATGINALLCNISASNSTACGNGALLSNTTGESNTAVGVSALYNNTSGQTNAAVGRSSLDGITTGNYNTAIGAESGIFYNTESCTFIGAGALALIPGLAGVNNSTALGNGAEISADNQVRIGNTLVTSIGGQVNFTAFSDGRYKKNIREDVPGLAFIMKLRPITYTLDVEGLDSKLNSMKPQRRVDPSIALKPTERSSKEVKARKEKAGTVYTGFVAEEVEQAAKELNYQFSGVDAPKNKDDFYGLRYAEFVVPLVKSVQEISTENQELKKEITELKDLINKLRTEVESKSD